MAAISSLGEIQNSAYRPTHFVFLFREICLPLLGAVLGCYSFYGTYEILFRRGCKSSERELRGRSEIILRDDESILGVIR